MATREQISAVLLDDIYTVGFASTNTAAQNLSLLNDTPINAIKKSIQTEDLFDVIVPSEIVGMGAPFRDSYTALMFPVFNRDSISRSFDPAVDHRNPTNGILAVQNILTAVNQGNSLSQTIVNYAAFIRENTKINILTNLGKVRSVKESMDYLNKTNPGW